MYGLAIFSQDVPAICMSNLDFIALRLLNRFRKISLFCWSRNAASESGKLQLNLGHLMFCNELGLITVSLVISQIVFRYLALNRYNEPLVHYNCLFFSLTIMLTAFGLLFVKSDALELSEDQQLEAPVDQDCANNVADQSVLLAEDQSGRNKKSICDVINKYIFKY
ncbi:MAG: hypothetical protein MHMPM18_003081 [Marteilia pararefringens]